MTVSRLAFLDLHAATRELRPALDTAIGRVIDRGVFILGDEVERFEAAFASYVGAKFCVTVGTGLDALHLALRASGVGPGDEVIVPAHTFIATWLAVVQAGATIVAVDVLGDTCNIDPDAVAAAITPRTRAICPVHLYGHPADLAALRPLARDHGLLPLEDAAQAHGAAAGGSRIGGGGSVAAWSFYPGKNLGALGDGGAVTTDDASLADRLRRFRNYGSAVKYHHDVMGTNSRLDPLQCAILGAKLDRLDEWNARRAVVASAYDGAFDEAAIERPRVLPETVSAHHLYPIMVDDREAVRAQLDAAGIDTMVHYPVPPHRQPAFAGAPASRQSFPAAERIAARVLSIPFGPHLAVGDVQRVITAVTHAVASLRRAP